MTAAQNKTLSILIDGLWSGDIGEVEFFECGLDCGASLDQLNAVLSEVREEDGAWS